MQLYPSPAGCAGGISLLVSLGLLACERGMQVSTPWAVLEMGPMICTAWRLSTDAGFYPGTGTLGLPWWC